MTRFSTSLFLPVCAVPLLLMAGCSRPQPTVGQVAGALSPPLLRYGAKPAGGVVMAPTGGGAGGSAAGGIQYVFQRSGGPQTVPVVSAPGGDAIVPNGGHRWSPTTSDAAENNSSSGSGLGDAGNPIPPNVPIDPKFAPGADLNQSPGTSTPTKPAHNKVIPGGTIPPGPVVPGTNPPTAVIVDSPGTPAAAQATP